MWLWPIFDYIKANRWAQIALITIATIATLGAYLAIRDNGVKQRERARQSVERARERVRMIERKSEIVMKERDYADAALEARDNSGPYPTYDSLPESHKAIAEGRAKHRS